jgi:predicted dithiol-disulfide oxidoreductase (DUF899 family)
MTPQPAVRHAQRSVPPITDRSTWEASVEELRVREKAHTREGDAIATARRRLPMVEVDPSTPLVGPTGEITLLDAFAGRAQLVAKYMMCHADGTLTHTYVSR